jgi:hemoglobin
MVDDALISELVERFYATARHDPLLGPIFSNAIGEDWTSHLNTMKAFWSSVLMGSGRYKGDPLAVHLALPVLSRPHFERWLELWRATAPEICGADAQVFIQRAESIAERLQSALSNSQLSQIPSALPSITSAAPGSQARPAPVIISLNPASSRAARH